MVGRAARLTNPPTHQLTNYMWFMSRIIFSGGRTPQAGLIRNARNHSTKHETHEKDRFFFVSFVTFFRGFRDVLSCVS